MISAKFVPLKYHTLSSQQRRLTSFSVGLFGSANSVTRSYPVMRKSCIGLQLCCELQWMYMCIDTITPCTHLRYDRSILYTNFVPCIKKLSETVGKKKNKIK